jgi:hypothetical protein
VDGDDRLDANANLDLDLELRQRKLCYKVFASLHTHRSLRENVWKGDMQ